MHYIEYYFILFFIGIFYKMVIIFQDEKIKKQSINQYFKLNKKKIVRGNIYDKNNLLLSYSRKIYKKNKKNKKYIEEKRNISFPSCIAILGLVNNSNTGLCGLESYFDNQLKLEIIRSFFSRETAHDKFKEKYKTIKKKNIFTTLDGPLSEAILDILNSYCKKFESQYATCIIMDGIFGDIEVITQYPQYLIDNQEKIDTKFLYPLAITQAHECGSIIKSFLMLAALNEKIVTPSTLINCYGVKERIIQHKLLTTWKAHGIIPFKTVIKESNNFGVAQIGLILNEKLFDYYKKFGFGEKTKITIHGEHGGILHSTEKWSKRSPISLSFGYEMSCTLLQLVSAWSTLTNNGRRVYPKLLKNQTTEYSQIICHEETIKNSLDILFLDQNNLKTYGLKKKIDANLYGKTGTANTINNYQYVKGSNIYTFIGHIEKNNTIKIIGISFFGSNNNELLASQIALPAFLDICQIINKRK